MTQHRADDAVAQFRGVRARGVVQCADLRATPEVLRDGGWWAVVADFDGPARAWRFADVEGSATDALEPPDHSGAPWSGPDPGSWRTSMDRRRYTDAVRRTREAIREGDVYQANICRVLSAPLGRADAEPDAMALAARLAVGNPAPYGGMVHVPAGSGHPPVWVVSASPELSLAVNGGYVESGPIKGTAPTAEELRPKDRAENVMITDLVRNDLQRVCAPGSVEVVDLLRTEAHPGLVHLVSRVRGRLTEDDPARRWAGLLAAAHPPGSVSGAPKSSALRLIAELEPVARGPYCGAVGWIDADSGQAELAVGIRTFWWEPPADAAVPGTLRFGTGAGITWGSDPEEEWAETELKARRLLALASSGSDPDAGAAPSVSA
ncbi:chorismate-binding protein [Georgenia faecalis]|uniref:chorismate-binding protein n=1 Tax=Georgenia faecalis TaxID=2483799 RepID=UPI000FDCDD8A|nr:chorismate-binding protein [Georgenia faecalis]